MHSFGENALILIREIKYLCFNVGLLRPHIAPVGLNIHQHRANICCQAGSK